MEIKVVLAAVEFDSEPDGTSVVLGVVIGGGRLLASDETAEEAGSVYPRCAGRIQLEMASRGTSTY